MTRLAIGILNALRFLIAPIVLAALCVYWVILLVLFTPFILADLLLQSTRRRYANEPARWNRMAATGEVFDRRDDVSKLYGCNTRNVRYRWSIFEDALRNLHQGCALPLRALDFGAGSFRDSYELASRGYAVTSVDLDPVAMRACADQYDWSATPGRPQLIAGSLDQLSGCHYDLIVAFDVIEHSDDPDLVIEKLSRLLAPGGLLLVTVPNGRSLYELHAHAEIAVKRRLRVTWQRGVPHLHFRTPRGWRRSFEAHQLFVRDHDMVIGPLVNDVFHTAFRVPLQWIIAPVLRRIRLLTSPAAYERLVRSFFPQWLVERVDLADQLLKPLTHHWFGWNLFVLSAREDGESGARREAV